MCMAAQAFNTCRRPKEGGWLLPADRAAERSCWELGAGLYRGGRRRVARRPHHDGRLPLEQQYRVLDSLQDPAVCVWWNYSLLALGPPPGHGDGPWQDAFYSKGPAGGWDTSTR